MFQIHAEGKDPDFRQEQRLKVRVSGGVNDAADVFILDIFGRQFVSRHVMKCVTTFHKICHDMHDVLRNIRDMPRHVVQNVTTCHDMSWIFL